jgi:tetratricopeptide (TPR) repeat protein
MRGEAALRRGDLGAAIGYLRSALQANGRMAGTHHLLGVALLARGELDEALSSLQAAARLDPQLAQASRRAFAVASATRGLARLEQGDEAGALADLRAALEADPGEAIAANAAAWILATSADPALRNPTEAVHAAERAVAARPDDPGFLDTLGASYAAAGRFPEAIASAERADALADAQGDAGLRDRIRERLAGYRAGVPYVARPDEATR